jgi:hypothetical protein
VPLDPPCARGNSRHTSEWADRTAQGNKMKAIGEHDDPSQSPVCSPPHKSYRDGDAWGEGRPFCSAQAATKPRTHCAPRSPLLVIYTQVSANIDAARGA